MVIANPFRTDPFRIVFRFCGLSAIFYGAFVWYFGSFSLSPAYSLYHDMPAWGLGLPLILGGATQFIGCYFYSKTWAIIGTGINASIFLAILISCIQNRPYWPSTVAHGVLVALFLLFIHCTIRSPLPCSTNDCRP